MKFQIKILAVLMLLTALTIIACAGSDTAPPAAPTYTVTYNANTGTGSVPTDSNTYSQTFTVTVLGNGTLAKAGYTFTCWNTQADGNGADLFPSATFAIGNANVILYAKWTADPTYTVTYSANTGTGAAPIDSNNYLAGATVTVLGNATLTKAGATFTCWNTQADGNGTDLSPSATFAIGNANVTLYAKWTADPTYTVTYSANTGTGAAPIDSNNYLAGATVTVLGNATLTKTCSTFTGWNTQADGNGTDRAPSSTFAIGSANVIFYAKWTAEPVSTWYRDIDADGYGNSSVTLLSCTQPAGYVAVSGDCNDLAASFHPGATEIPADGLDQNCDIRESCYTDADRDFYGTNVIISSADMDCIDVGEATNNMDCNDGNAAISPGVTEVLNGIDDDCDTVIDEGF